MCFVMRIECTQHNACLLVKHVLKERLAFFNRKNRIETTKYGNVFLRKDKFELKLKSYSVVTFM